MASETFYNYRHFLWLKVTIVLVLLSAGIYVSYEPIGGHRGSSWLGYSLGILAGIGMIILMWYGRRKRAYHSRITTLQGALSVHVWLGIGLLVLVPLHSGFRVGFNIHGAAYILLVLTVLTGIWGAMNYTRLAPQVLAHRGEGTVPQLLEQIHDIQEEKKRLLQNRSDEFLVLHKAIDFTYTPGIMRSLFSQPPKELDREKVASLLVNVPDAERKEAVALVSINSRRRRLTKNLHDEVAVQALLKIWLYTHVPLAVACFIVFIIHVVLVFEYY